MKYQLCSYLLQDGRWGPAFLPPQGSKTFSEPTELDIYFPTQKDADKYAKKYLIEKGISIEDIEVRKEKENKDYDL